MTDASLTARFGVKVGEWAEDKPLTLIWGGVDWLFDRMYAL